MFEPCYAYSFHAEGWFNPLAGWFNEQSKEEWRADTPLTAPCLKRGTVCLIPIHFNSRGWLIIETLDNINIILMKPKFFLNLDTFSFVMPSFVITDTVARRWDFTLF